MTKLTVKQLKFVEEYLEDYNASQAALRAGYASVDEGYRLTTKPHIQEAIKAAAANRNLRLGISKDFIVAELVDALLIAKAEVKPKLNAKTGKPITHKCDEPGCQGHPVYVRNEPAIAKYIELLAKHVDIGAFSNELNVKVTKEEELMASIEEGLEQARLSLH